MILSDFTQLGAPISDLSRIENLLKKIGNPQEYLKFVHIAGTNGKGSTLEFISGALIYSNYKVGQFTSPYNLVFEDRIRINGKNIQKDVFNRYFRSLANIVKKDKYSQFEIIFACALLYFSDNNCDIVCLETGIGGLLDATNIIQNVIVSVITSISFDHMSILGSTLEQIAYQKAGIIKKNVPVVIANDNLPHVIEIIKLIAEKVDAPYIIPTRQYYDVHMLGQHQQINAQNAKSAVEILQKNGFNVIESNFLKSLKNVQVPARMEIISNSPLIICDGAHNYGAICKFVDEILNFNSKFEVIFGVMNTKEYIKITKEVEKIAEHIFLVSDFDCNSMDTSVLKECFSVKCYITNCNNVIKQALEFSNKIVICGSIYLRSKIDFTILNYNKGKK